MHANIFQNFGNNNSSVSLGKRLLAITKIFNYYINGIKMFYNKL